ncbi:hypothetical protein F7725_008894 [Dissostichus mawsoni]|uniref:Uncharacterized protein n=1 Tax=Dissostichus mawsoni TaxID=36200 RepID=A0A7J5Z5I7_DISMA|nr:hypothetical protein F7725_008894 [Dissostichus mawsoni]
MKKMTKRWCVYQNTSKYERRITSMEDVMMRMSASVMATPVTPAMSICKEEVHDHRSEDRGSVLDKQLWLWSGVEREEEKLLWTFFRDESPDKNQ